MTKRLLFITLLSLILPSASAFADGYEGRAWQNPELNAIHRLPMYAYFAPFKSESLALQQSELPVEVRFLPNYQGERRISLDGVWRFKLYQNPSECEGDGFLKEEKDDWDTITVPGSWELQGFDSPIYTDERYPFPPNPPHIPKEYNPVGIYATTFEWSSIKEEEMDYILTFNAVESAFYVWLNGIFLGYSEDSRLPAKFDATKLLKGAIMSSWLKCFATLMGLILRGKTFGGIVVSRGISFLQLVQRAGLRTFSY